MTNGNDFASPSHQDEYLGTPFMTGGLTKREYFAAMALQGIIAAQRICETGIDHEANAEASAKAADSLINALNEKP